MLLTVFLQKKMKPILCFMLAVLIFFPAGAYAATDGTVTTKSLILRKSASKESKAVQTLKKGDKLEIDSATGDWYKVKAAGYSGYVMKSYVDASGKVEEKKEEKEEKGKESATESLRLGDKGNAVKAMQTSLKKLGFYTSTVDGVFGKGTEKAVKAFQKKNKLTQDGIAGAKTLEKLSSGDVIENEMQYKTERLNWFKGGESIIPKGASMTIKDVKTGKTFSAKRWSGANHIDAEPSTGDDTKTMKAVFGGDWSWKRRAILVKYNGHVYAASMNGMPHGSQVIDNNGFDGHFCIHFYQTKTHGTNKVDGEHQNMVDAAMKATW